MISQNFKSFLLLLIRSVFNGFQWVGWSWAVLVSQQVVVSLLGWEMMRNIIVSLSIAINEMIWSQVFGRIVLRVDRYSFDKDHSTSPVERVSEMNNIHKNMVACIASGIVFDFVDRTVESVCSKTVLDNSMTLLMRCVWVFVADRLIFHAIMEILDRIESGSWSFLNEISNIEGASSAGFSAIAYNLSTELGIYICKEHIRTDNEWLIGLFCSPLIAIATSLGFIVGVVESKLWNLLDRLRIYSKICGRFKNRTENSNDHSNRNIVEL